MVLTLFKTDFSEGKRLVNKNVGHCQCNFSTYISITFLVVDTDYLSIYHPC